MAIASVETYGLLNRWPIRMTENLYHFNQLAGVNAPLTNPGDYVYVQYERDKIADAIEAAYLQVVDSLGFYPRPTYLSERIWLNQRQPFNWQALRTKYGYLDAIGRRTASAIQSGAAVAFSGDTATITVNTTVTDITEIQVFYRVADGAYSAANDLFRIEPLRVSLSGGVATITGHRALFAKPSNFETDFTAPNYNQSNKKVWDSADAASYVTSVDIYRVYADASTGVVFVKDPQQYSIGEPPNEYLTAAGVGLIEDARIGTFRPRLPEGVYCSPYEPFEAVDVYYRAGYPLTATGDYYRPLANAILGLANCHLGEVLMPFDQQRMNVFSYDIAIPSWGSDRLIEDYVSPYGRQRGQVEAWMTVQRMMLGMGGVLGGGLR